MDTYIEVVPDCCLKQVSYVTLNAGGIVVAKKLVALTGNLIYGLALLWQSSFGIRDGQ